MDKMRSRVLDADVSIDEDEHAGRLIALEVGDGENDLRLAVDVLTERDARLAKALDGLQKRVPFYVDMDKQVLHPNANDNGAADRLISDRPDYDVYNINNIATSTVKGGVGDWSKGVGKYEEDVLKGDFLDIPGLRLTASERDLLGGLEGGGGRGKNLILSPTSGRDLLSTTNHTGTNVVPSWKTSENVPRFSISKPIAPSELDFADIDPHKFKKVWTSFFNIFTFLSLLASLFLVIKTAH